MRKCANCGEEIEEGANDIWCSDECAEEYGDSGGMTYGQHLEELDS